VSRPATQDVAKKISSTFSRVGFDIPWELLIDLIIQIIEKYFSHSLASFRSAARSPSWLDVMRLERCCLMAIRRTDVDWRDRRALARELCDAILAEAAWAPEATLQAVYDECK